MRLFTLLPVLLLSAFCAAGLSAQTVLFAENFQDCALPTGWDVVKNGNQNPVWYVGNAVQNDDNNGQSMNGSCFLFIDDDATGDNTLAYTIDFISPPFDASQHATVALQVDIHYRDWYEAEEFFTVLVTDGVTETALSRFDGHRQTGDSLGDYLTLKYDLSLVTNSSAVRLIFRYDDAGGYNWWAGVDNILVIGSGQGSNVVAETFNACQLPAGWESEIVQGNDGWRFGLIDTFSKAYDGGTSMDGSCFAYFDDDVLGEDAPFSKVRLSTPWFTGTDFARFTLQFDVILRYYKEKIAVYVQHGDGQEYLVVESTEDVGGPNFPDYGHVPLDLSSYRSQQMRVVFEYDDGKAWGWWAGLDNVKITGEGVANDLCSQAKTLLTGNNCQPGDNRTAVFDGPVTACTDKGVGGLWYKWTPSFSGIANMTTQARFNDVVNVFTGGCATPQLLHCDNRDEHGFTGERSYFNVQAGTEYLLRVSGRDAGFGMPRGDLCIAVNQAQAFPSPPAHDDCSAAVNLAVNGVCVAGNNLHGTMSSVQPALNALARADVWYKFTAPVLTAGEQLEIASNATFSDIITVYQGGCAALAEVAADHHGGRLTLPALTAGQTYFVQIAGNFATVEGSLCPQLLKKTVNAPANDLCAAAISVPIGGQCTVGSNVHATYSGLQPACALSVDQDIWFKFIAPASGAVRINSGADFAHVLAVWQGNCTSMTQLFCAENPLRCDGYLLVGGLTAGQTYYVQTASSRTAAGGLATGNVCLKILDVNTPPDFQPLGLQVQENCTGIGTAQILVTTNGGLPPLTFQGSPDGQILNSGDIYLVVVTDALGCTQSLAGIVKACDAGNCLLNASLTPTSPACYGAANGSLTVTTSGGVTPYQYKWSNNSTGAALSNISAGIYAVTVTDALGCEAILSYTLSNPPAIEVLNATVLQPAAGQTNGSIHIDVQGGSGQYAYSWTLNGLFFVASEDLTLAPAGNYQLQITDANGCTALFEYALLTVGTATPEADVFAEIFPNPARDKATLAVAFFTPQALLLSLTDAAGRVLRSWRVDNVTEQNIPLEIRDLSAGAYQLRISRVGRAVITRTLTVVR